MKVISNLITEGLSGKVEQSKYCFRRHYGSTFLTLKSIPSGEETPQQRLVKSWFTEAQRLANVDMGDDAKRRLWEQNLKKTKYKTPKGRAFAHYFQQLKAGTITVPEITEEP